MSRTADLREQAMKYLTEHTIKETPATLQNWMKLKLETDGYEDREHHPLP